MLQPTDRRLLCSMLSRHPRFQTRLCGRRLHVGLVCLVVSTGRIRVLGLAGQRRRPTGDPLALLKAVREYADRICLFFQAGRIHVPQNYQPLLASVESSLVETLAPRGGSFTPKVWFLAIRRRLRRSATSLSVPKQKYDVRSCVGHDALP